MSRADDSNKTGIINGTILSRVNDSKLESLL